jgi:hypothetical protein
MQVDVRLYRKVCSNKPVLETVSYDKITHEELRYNENILDDEYNILMIILP